MSIKNWPHQERPREKLINKGVSSLSDAELLAILIGIGTRKHTSIAIARDLLKSFGNIRSVTNARYKELCALEGLGNTFYARLQAANEISRRCLMETIRQGNAMINADKVKDFLHLKMRHYENEVFACLFLNNKHRIIAFEELFMGTIDNAHIHAREIIKRSLHHNAAAIIFAHNHPSGSAEPSASDQHLTDELKKTLSAIDVRVLDHFVVGEDIVSFAERDLI